MILHFLLLSFVFILSYFYRKNNPNSKKAKVLFATLSIVLVLFLGLRDITIGTDTKNYVSMFLGDGWTNDNIEIGFSLLSWFTKIFTSHYYLFLILTTVIAISGVLYSAKKYDFDTEIFIFLYIASFSYLYSASATRFFCALSIIIFSIKFMIEQKNTKVFICIFIAMLFHTSTLLFIPIYLLSKIKFNKTNIALIVILLSVLVLLLELTGGTRLFNLDLFQKYSYIEESKNFQFGPSILINIAILILSLIYYNKIKEYKKEYEFFVKIHIMGSFIDLISIAYRSVWLFKFPTWFIIPIILKNIKKDDAKTYYLLYFITIISYGAYYYLLLKASLPSHNFLNYKFNIGLE